MKAFAIVLLCVIPLTGQGQEAKLPVFFLRYDGALGSEETEEENIEQSSNRHTVSFRIKEEFSKVFTANLLSAYSRKEYLLQAGSYWYFYVRPSTTVRLSDRVRWDCAFRSKWVLYDELDSGGFAKNYTNLLFDTKLSFKPIDELSLIPSAKGVYDLNENRRKSKQAYTFGFALNARIENINLGAKYRAMPRFPLGADSDVPFRFSNEFGANLSWDPNK